MTTLGKYELNEALGQGGFASLYRATDVIPWRVVAIKVLNMIESGRREHGV